MDYFANHMNEMGLTLNKKISDLKPGDKNVDIKVILVSMVSKNTLKNEQKIKQFLVADNSGSIYCNLYDDVGEVLTEGDVIFLKSSYASVFKNNLILYANKPGYGQVVKLGEFFMTYNETPNLSLTSWKKDKDEKTGLYTFVVDNLVIN
jgi:ssDNA-binding replication factor A large subunit